MNTNIVYDVVIVGGGAAGLFAASTPHQRVKGLILDKAKSPGLKLLMSGSGMCNLTHSGTIKDFVDRYGDNGSKIRTCLYKFNNLAVMDFFESRGVKVFSREDGKVFPVSLQAREVLDCLLRESERNGFELVSSCQVNSINPGDVFSLETNLGTVKARKVIICTGGCSYPTTGSDGSIFEALKSLDIEIVPTRPALVPVFVENYTYGGLSGASVRNVKIQCEGHTVTGDVLFTHKNFSGPGILHISRYVKPGSRLTLCFLPEANRDSVIRDFKDALSGRKELRLPAQNNEAQEPPSFSYRNQSGGAQTPGDRNSGGTQALSDRNQSCDAQAPGVRNSGGAQALSGRKEALTVFSSYFNGLPSPFLRQLLEEEGVEGHQPFNQCPFPAALRVLDRLFSDSFSVSGTAGYGSAMATAGGVSLKEINSKTGESKKIPGLYFAGEVLDVDGDTGGYNLQFAFSSAYRAISSL